ncbi:MAG: hypothetical protein AMJ54_01145 [Deltaproteobacteria bacterium SG8_13]|nr:MAG: hypothetical protein AMJ54_01145 [Deltaproteobacteria bacterium SG8_13]
MKDPQTIIEAYRRADDEKRLYLFLECRSLRHQFVQIEHEAYHERLQDASALDKKREKGSVWRSLWTRVAFDKS